MRGKRKKKDLLGVTEKDVAVNILDVLPANRVIAGTGAKSVRVLVHEISSSILILQIRLCRRGESEERGAEERRAVVGLPRESE